MPAKAKAAKPPARTEASVLKGCLMLLGLRGIPCWRNNTGAAKVGGRFVRFGTKGGADILGVVPKSGRLLAVECKRPGGKTTPAQDAFLFNVAAAGGVALLIDDEADLSDVLDRLAADPWTTDFGGLEVRTMPPA